MKRHLKNPFKSVISVIILCFVFKGCLEVITEIPIEMNLSTDSLSFSYSGGEKSFTVFSNTNKWQVSSNVSSWLKVSPELGSRRGSVKVIVESNSDITPKTAVITVSGVGVEDKTIKVNIDAAPTLLVFPTSLNFISASDSKAFSIISNTNWTINNTTSWLTVTPTSGVGDSIAIVTASANTSQESRNAILTISGTGVKDQTINITQSASPTLSVTSSLIIFTYSREDRFFSIRSNTNWTVSSSEPSWLSVYPTSGSNNGNITVTAVANSSSIQRTATITINSPGLTPQIVNVTQLALLNESWRSYIVSAMTYYPTQTYSNGTYKGQMYNGSRFGLGAYYWNEDGGFHFGGYSNGMRNGIGIYIVGSFTNYRFLLNCPDCKIYVGNWSDNDKWGYGTCYDKHGNLIYDGNFYEDYPSSSYPSSSYMTTNNFAWKFQVISYNDGSFYIGETFNGKRHGYGIFIWQNLDMWYGPWADNIRNGYGIYIFSNGNIQTGTWYY